MTTPLRRSLLAAVPVLLVAIVATAATPAPAETAAPSEIAAQAPAAKTLGIDGSHSFVMFKVRHNGVNDAWGRFNQVSGEIVLDDDAAKSRVKLVIPADSVDTGNEKRDGHLKSPDFFNAVEFPEVVFESTRVKAAGKDAFEVTGDLTLHGVTKSLTVNVTRAVAEGRRGSVYGFGSTFTFKRSDFGMDYGIDRGSLGDEITVYLNLEAGER